MKKKNIDFFSGDFFLEKSIPLDSPSCRDEENIYILFEMVNIVELLAYFWPYFSTSVF